MLLAAAARPRRGLAPHPGHLRRRVRRLWPLGRSGRRPSRVAGEILLGSRIPRLAAGIAVGFALGVAGALLQSLARNALASPDTLAVTGGAYLAVTSVAAFGLSVPLWASGLAAFVGGLAAAALVLGLAGGAGTSTTRLLLAGSAVALALQAATATLLILFSQKTTSLFAWGSGSLSQLGLDAFLQAAPVVVVATGCALLLARRLDLLALGDDTRRGARRPGPLHPRDRHRAGRGAHRRRRHPGRARSASSGSAHR